MPKLPPARVVKMPPLRIVDDPIALELEKQRNAEDAPLLRPDPSKGDYHNWSTTRQRDYWHKMASAMNQAADRLQEERNHAYRHAANMEQQCKAAKSNQAQAQQFLQQQIQRANEQQNTTNQRAIELRKIISDKDREIARLKKLLTASPEAVGG